MADIRISQLPAVTTPGDSDPFHLIAGVTDSRIAFSNLKNAVRPADGTTTVSGLLRLATNADISGSVATAAVGADLLKALNDRVAALEAGGGGGGGGGAAAPSGVLGTNPLDANYVITTLANGSKFLMQWGVVAFSGNAQQLFTHPTTFSVGSFPSVTLTPLTTTSKLSALVDTQATSFRFTIYELDGTIAAPGTFVAWQALGPAP